MTVTNMPVPFAGTEEERRANHATHHWVTYDMEEPPECANCCAKEWHVAADYPCGEEPPRMTTTEPIGEPWRWRAWAAGFRVGRR